MKKGIEVEGILRGLSTIFVDASEVLTVGQVLDLVDHPEVEAARHLYVSDHSLEVSIESLASYFPRHYITWEVRTIPKDPTTLPNNMGIMLSGCPDFWQIKRLRPCDQLKFSDGQNVVVFSMKDAMFTAPHEFEGDVEL